MSLGERIKQVRKTLGLTQREFGERIGMKQNSVAQVEMGRNTSEQTILTICREFDVDEEWLRNGNGKEMFKSKPSSLLDLLVKEFNLSGFGRAVVEKMLRLNEKQWQAVCEFMTETITDLSKGAAAYTANAQLDKPAVTAKEETTTSTDHNQTDKILLEAERITPKMEIPAAVYEEILAKLNKMELEIKELRLENEKLSREKEMYKELLKQEDSLGDAKNLSNAG